jgi:hypothetical protein
MDMHISPNLIACNVQMTLYRAYWSVETDMSWMGGSRCAWVIPSTSYTVQHETFWPQKQILVNYKVPMHKSASFIGSSCQSE